jgi:hypothetical protein
MLHHTALGNARIEAFIASARRADEARRLHNRGSPFLRLRLVLARRIVLVGARLHGRDPAVIGGRVVILDDCGHVPQELRPAA